MTLFGQVLDYNTVLVAIGAMLLGIAAGGTGTFPLLRKRALVSDAISHATLPGVGIAFLVMVAMGLDGRSLLGLLLGAAATAGVGLLAVNWLASRPRLSEDAAIGAVLSVFFGFGVVLLTVIQTSPSGSQAGLDGLLLGATASMLFAEAVLIALGGALCLALVVLFRRPMALVAFDAGHARSIGVDARKIDLITMGLVLAVTVVGLKVVGLIMIVALLIIPPVAARFWTERTDHMVLIAGLIGGVSGVAGALLSAFLPDLPTGPVVVLVAFALFGLSLILSPRRGVLSLFLRRIAYRRLIHVRQGLLALASGQPIYEALTLRLLEREGLIRKDGVATEKGAARAAKALRDEARWRMARKMDSYAGALRHHDGLAEIETILTADQIAEIDRAIGGPAPVPQ